MSTPALNPLVTKIRAMHPGAYDDMDDATLTKAVLAKYPQYSDLAVPGPSSMMGAPQQRMNMQPDSGGLISVPPAGRIPGVQTNAQQVTPGEAAGGLAGGAAAGALPFLAPSLAKGALSVAKASWPAAKGLAKTAAVTSAAEAAIQGAKKLPVVGSYVSKVPGIDYLPLFLGGMMGGEKGKGKEPVYPSTPEGPTALPEQLNPALASEARSLPGQVSPEVIRPPAEPIPARKGLALPPGPETSPLPQALQPRAPAQSEAQTPPQPRGGGTGKTVADEPSTGQPQVAPNRLDDLLRNAVGNQPVKPGVKMRDQMKPDLPEGHTSVESSALRSYKYDPDARELHIKSGSTVYTYGDVSPEDAQVFQGAKSKGKAWQAIQQNNVLVKKNGKPVRPSDNGEDLTPVLQQMLDQAKANKK